MFVQANFGRRDELTVTGIYLGDEFADDNPMREARNAAPVQGAGSVIAVVATDAPLFPSQCKAFARRVTSGLARTGTSGSHFSGDLFLAFSTANPGGLTSGDPNPNAAKDAAKDKAEDKKPKTKPERTTSSPSSRGTTWTRFSRPSSRPQKRLCSTP